MDGKSKKITKKVLLYVLLIILALIWMRTSALPLFISFLMVFPILYTNVLAGIRSADRELLEMARVFRVPWLRQARCRISAPRRRLRRWSPTAIIN